MKQNNETRTPKTSATKPDNTPAAPIKEERFPADDTPFAVQTRIDQRKRVIINIIYWVLILLLVYFVFKYLIFYIMPFVIGFAIAFVLQPIILWIVRKTKMKHNIVAIVLVTLFYCTIGVLLILLGVRIFTYLESWFRRLPALYTSTIEPYLYQLGDDINENIHLLDPAIVKTIEDIFNNAVQSLGNTISSWSLSVVGWISNVAKAVPGFLLNTLFMIISTFFMAIDYSTVTGFIKRQLPSRARGIVLDTKRYLGEVIVQFARSYSLILGITFVELLIGLLIIGVKNFVLLAFLIAIFDILPVVGTGTVILPWAAVCFITGNIGMGVGLLILYAAITIIRNIIEPKIVGKNVGLHPLVTLMSMFVGAKLFGAIGLFGLPISLAILTALNQKGAIKIFK